MSLFAELKRRNVVRVGVAYLISAWIIAQVVDLVLDGIKAPDWVMQTILLLMGIGFIIALIISWAYEITPEGIKKEADVVRDDSITHVTAKKLNVITLFGVMIVITMLLWQQFIAEPKILAEPKNNQNNVDITASSQKTSLSSAIDLTLDSQNKLKAKLVENSIAVLPFANRSNNDDDLYFTDGIHDDILTQLAKIKAMRVTSRTSVMKFRDTDKTIPEIARELGVTTILEGGVQRAGKRIRINAQLIDVATDEHLWAETFDREMTIDNLFDIQSEITKHIVKAVKGQLDPEEIIFLEHKQTQSLEAWEAYSKARQLIIDSGYNAEKYITALPLVERAIELDPLFLSAQLMMVEVRALLYWTNTDLSEDNKQKTLTALNNAIKIAPTSADVLMAQGVYAYRINQDFHLALNYQKSALEDNHTNAVFLENIALTQRRLGMWEEAIDNLLFAAKLAPDNLSIMTTTAGTLNLIRDTKRLTLFLKTVRKRFPNDPELESHAANLALTSEGDLEKAKNIYQDIIPNASRTYILSTFDFAWQQRNQSAIIEASNRPEVITFLERYPTFLETNRGLAYHVYGNNKLANIEFNKVISLMHKSNLDERSLIQALQLTNLAIAKVLLGDSDTGIELARQALDMYSSVNDKADGPIIDAAVCYVLALAGQRDEALKMIEKLLDTPAGYNRWNLYLDPRWDFFRDDERFNKLIKPLNFDDSPYAKKRAKNKNQADKS